MMKVTFKTISNQAFQYDLDETFTVRFLFLISRKFISCISRFFQRFQILEIKQKISAEKGVPIDSQKLIYNGKVLVDSDPLHYINYNEQKYIVWLVHLVSDSFLEYTTQYFRSLARRIQLKKRKSINFRMKKIKNTSKHQQKSRKRKKRQIILKLNQNKPKMLIRSQRTQAFGEMDGRISKKNFKRKQNRLNPSWHRIDRSAKKLQQI